MRKTKIVCTIGPATDDPELVRSMIIDGMNVARINFSHQNHAIHKKRIDNVRRFSKELGINVGVLADTRGPEIRIGTFEKESIELVKDQEFRLTTKNIIGNEKKVSVNYPRLTQDVSQGSVLLIDDGNISMRIVRITKTEIICEVINGGCLTGGKGINLPGTVLNLPALSELDRQDILFALEQDVEFIAASFIRKQSDILEIRNFIDEYNSDVKIIAKIETQEGVDNFLSILEVADGIMIARGDLGVEIPVAEVPLVQKFIIECCNKTGKPVITATQMLESMINTSRPTRAEASDIANAIFDGTDAVMLSGETAIGSYPLESISIMSEIAKRADHTLHFKEGLCPLDSKQERTVTDSISYSTCHTAKELSAAAIITMTHSGKTARMVSKYHPYAPIIAVTPIEKTAKTLTLTWGVYAIKSSPIETIDSMFEVTIRTVLDSGMVKVGDLVVMTGGVPIGVSGSTNLLRVESIKESSIQRHWLE